MDTSNLVYRQFALPVETFDYLKSFQRSYERKHNVRLNNNQLLVMMIDEHKASNNSGIADEERINHGIRNSKVRLLPWLTSSK